MREQFDWRTASAGDLDVIAAIERQVHTLAAEGRDAFEAKLRAFPQGTQVLHGREGTAGYGVFHPWRLNDAPALGALPFTIPPASDCLFVHDVAILPAARGQGAVRRLLMTVETSARALGLAHLGLVSVYDTAQFWMRLGFIETTLPFDAAKRAQYGASARYMVAALG